MLGSDLKLEDIGRDDVYDFSFPCCPERCAAIENKFPGLPLLIVDRSKRLVWGHAYRRWLQGKGRKKTVVFMADIAPAAALFLNFNLSNRIFGLNLYEKLLFVSKIIGLCPIAEIQRRAELDFHLNDTLLRHLDALLSGAMRPVLAAGQLGLKAALRLAETALPDRRALLGLFKAVRFSDSHQLQVIRLLEETAFREKKSFARILAAAEISGLLKQEMPQQKILAALHRLRFPAWSRHESEWRQWQKKKAHRAGVVLSHDPFFTSEEITISLTAKNRLEAEELLEKLSGKSG
jgi:hypothetical protein